MLYLVNSNFQQNYFTQNPNLALNCLWITNLRLFEIKYNTVIIKKYFGLLTADVKRNVIAVNCHLHHVTGHIQMHMCVRGYIHDFFLLNNS